MQKLLLLPLLGAGVLLSWPIRAAAEAPTASDDWRYAASVYLWAAGTKGTTGAGSDIDVGFDTLISNLNMAFMGTVEARRGKWSGLADVLYLNVGANESSRVPLTTPSGETLGLRVDAGIKQRGWVWSFLGGYNLRDNEKLTLDVIAGARYLELKVEFDLALQSRPFGRPIEVSASDSVWDAVLGLRGGVRLDGNWYLPFQLDLGTGQSDLTWQAAGGVGYRFNWGDVELIYRYMEWDFDSGSAIDDMSFSGPQLTARFHF